MMSYLRRFSVPTLRLLVRLSESALLPILGAPPRNAHGAPLDRQLHALSLFRRAVPLREILEQGVRPTRLLSKMAINVFDFVSPELPLIEDRTIEGPAGPIPLRLYTPRLDAELPGCLFFHGGGFVLGDLDTHDSFCRQLARRGKCHVVSVDYRLAPEDPFPAPVEDAVTAYRWVHRNADQFNIDPDRLAVAGDSAGGTLATVVSQLQIKENRKCPDFQLLMYPKTDHGTAYPSRTQPNENLFLTWRAVEWFSEQYLSGTDVDTMTDHRVSPLRFEQLDQMPPTLLAPAGFDPLRDEGIAYADKLQENGVRVLRRNYERLIHGFISIGGIIDRAREAVDQLADDFRNQIHGS